MVKANKRWLLILLMLVVVLSLPITAQAKVKINKKKATITVGKTLQLKIKGTKKKKKWSSSNKWVATVNKKGKVKGLRAGRATITAKVGKKKYKCKVTVKANSTNTYPSVQKNTITKPTRSTTSGSATAEVTIGGGNTTTPTTTTPTTTTPIITNTFNVAEANGLVKIVQHINMDGYTYGKIRNGYSQTVRVKASFVIYNGNAVADTGYDYILALDPGQEAWVHEYWSDTVYTNSNISLEVSEPSRYATTENRTNSLNIGSMSINNGYLFIPVSNSGSDRLYYELTIKFYKGTTLVGMDYEVGYINAYASDIEKVYLHSVKKGLSYDEEFDFDWYQVDKYAYNS